MAAADPEYETAVHASTNGFNYSDASVVLLVDTENFEVTTAAYRFNCTYLTCLHKVSRNRLTAACPALRMMFELPQVCRGTAVT